MKSFFHIAILIFIGALAFVAVQDHFVEYKFSFEALSDTHENWNPLSLLESQSRVQENYHVWAVGDIMLDRGVWSRVVQSPGGDFDFPFDLIRDDLAGADYVFGNLEGTVSDIGRDTGKKYSFRFKPEFAAVLERASFDVVSLANNHMMDWGRDALCDTTRNLDQAGVAYVGAGCNSESAEKPHLSTIGDTNVAFLAYTEFYKGAHATATRAGMSEFNMDTITARITELKSRDDIDLVFVSFHAGTEYEPRSNEFQQKTYKALVDAGADVVIGHHPHVPQEIERYGQGWIIYSLGNFVFDQSWSEETMQGMLADIQIREGRVQDIVTKKIQINNQFQPYIVQ
jgi:poly-gamma-glutamate synthesis protein (capsule biosynthesis protein)